MQGRLHGARATACRTVWIGAFAKASYFAFFGFTMTRTPEFDGDVDFSVKIGACMSLRT